jgi:hypothetical protein
MALFRLLALQAVTDNLIPRTHKLRRAALMEARGNLQVFDAPTEAVEPVQVLEQFLAEQAAARRVTNRQPPPQVHLALAVVALVALLRAAAAQASWLLSMRSPWPPTRFLLSPM